MTLLHFLEAWGVLSLPVGICGGWVLHALHAAPKSQKTPAGPHYELVDGETGQPLKPRQFLDGISDPVGAHRAAEARGLMDGRSYGVIAGGG